VPELSMSLWTGLMSLRSPRFRIFIAARYHCRPDELISAIMRCPILCGQQLGRRRLYRCVTHPGGWLVPDSRRWRCSCAAHLFPRLSARESWLVGSRSVAL
jgi:hypothetical protein